MSGEPPKISRLEKLSKKLGVPDMNPTDPADIATKREAEEFVMELEADLDAYDAADMEALEKYVTRSRLGRWFFGDSSSSAIPPATASIGDAPGDSLPSAAAASIAAGVAITAAKSSKVMRTRATDINFSPNEETVVTPAGKPPPQQQVEPRRSLTQRLMFRRYNPNRTPLIARWYVPYICAGVTALIWTPDHWKLRTLYLADAYYAQLRRAIHTEYWRMTMNQEDFATLMEQMEANMPRDKRTVKGTDCPM